MLHAWNTEFLTFSNDVNEIFVLLQIHLVHMNEKYATFADALEHQDGLAVVGAFLQVSSNDY